MDQKILSWMVQLAVVVPLGVAPALGQTAVSAASYKPVIAPNSIASFFGTSLAGTTASATLDANGQLPFNLAGVAVQIGSSPARLFYVSPSQINFLVPDGIAAGQPPISILNDGSVVATGVATIADVAPALFGLPGARGAIINAFTGALEPFDTTDIRSPDGRARLSIYATGLNSPLSSPRTFTAYATPANGSPIQLPIEYAGPQGQYAGLDQINVVVPPELDGAGDVAITVAFGDIRSNAAKWQ